MDLSCETFIRDNTILLFIFSATQRNWLNFDWILNWFNWFTTPKHHFSHSTDCRCLSRISSFFSFGFNSFCRNRIFLAIEVVEGFRWNFLTFYERMRREKNWTVKMRFAIECSWKMRFLLQEAKKANQKWKFRSTISGCNAKICWKFSYIQQQWLQNPALPFRSVDTNENVSNSTMSKQWKWFNASKMNDSQCWVA